MLAKHERDYKIFIDGNETTYGIIGAVSKLDEVITKDNLPYLCETVLVPYKKIIVYDGVITGMGFRMGDGIQSHLVKILKDATIYKSLPVRMN